MPRMPRIQYEGALYHVINRGNYRRAIFETTGAAHAFEAVLSETCLRHRWRVHAYAIMRNHFHLALETPQANLVEGMHWLQGTFASRFNRFREEHGHLFQGRYKALLVEDAAALMRVVHYIHLNPVRAAVVPPASCATFRWGSLPKLRRPERPVWLAADILISRMGFPDSAAGWRRYAGFLAELAANTSEQAKLEFDRLSSGWAIGTQAWRSALAKEYQQLSLRPGLERRELRMLREEQWRESFDRVMAELGKPREALANEASDVGWKIAAAARLRSRGVPYSWIGRELILRCDSKLRGQVFQFRRAHGTDGPRGGDSQQSTP